MGRFSVSVGHGYGMMGRDGAVSPGGRGAWLIFGFLALGIFLMWFYSRWRAIGGFPVFIDEAYLLERMTPFIQRGSILVEGGRDRMFLAWWTTLFHMVGNEQIWLARTATVMFNSLGVAWAMAIGALLGGRVVGLVVGLLMVLLPYELFFGRMLLSDSTVATWFLGAVWATLHYVRRPDWRWAVAVGGLLALAFLGKATAVFLLVLPVIATILLWGRWRDSWRLWLISGGIFIGIWAPFLALISWRGHSYFDTVGHLASFSWGDFFERTLGNMTIGYGYTLAWFSGGFVLMLVVAMGVLVLWRRRTGLFLAGMTVAPLLGVVMTAGIMRSRYTAFSVPMMAIIVAWGAVMLAERLGMRHRLLALVPYGALALWALAFALPFHQQYAEDAETLGLYQGDYGEYMRDESSGFGLDEIGRYLDEHATAEHQVVGVLANCGGLRLMMKGEAGLMCLQLSSDGRGQDAISAELAGLTAQWGAALWVVYERLPYSDAIELDGSWSLIGTYERPQSDRLIYLYRGGSY